ncbi:transportin-1 [Gossypium australe]|uniref:Transportin-1 n=1 Tax=Gossypium australe TaxID=47621 RepID=A0A5B6W2N7_9ROSI|nr:transportin-1 [Gossypium australe]
MRRTITRLGPWQPHAERLNQIILLLPLDNLPFSTVIRTQIRMHLLHFSLFDDFNNYLAFILSRAKDVPVEIRKVAGLLLKNGLMAVYNLIEPEHQQYIKLQLLYGLGEADQHIRSTCGTTISNVVQQGGILGWPELFHTLLHFLNSGDPNRNGGAMDALSKISENTPELLDSDDAWSGQRPINIFLLELFEFFHSPHANLRKLSLRFVNKYIISMPSGLYTSKNKYLDGLFLLANEPDAAVRKLLNAFFPGPNDQVCTALLQLVEFHPSVLEPRLKDVIECMLQLNKDKNDVVALGACGFWSKYWDAQIPSENLREYLPRLTLILLSNMAYPNDDDLLADAEVIDAKEDESIPDRYQDLKPQLPCSDEDDDTCTICNLRKCSASALDVLSNVFGAKILLTFMPIIEANLSATGDEAWREKEAAVLALGVIARGCINGLYPRLSEIVASLIPLLDHKFTLIRSTSCWTLSQFSKYIVQDSGNKKGYEQFDMVLTALLQRISDTNKLVQGAACSALAILEEEAAEKLAPRLKEILQHLMHPLGEYQKRNLRIICDAIGTLVDAVGEELDQPVYVEILIPPLIQKWQNFSIFDKDLLTLIECFTSIVQALGGIEFSQFTEHLFSRCITMIEAQQRLAKAHPFSDKDFITCSLDFLSGLTGCFDSGIESLVLQSNLRDMLVKCCRDGSPDVRQSAFGLLGDLARVKGFRGHEACNINKPRAWALVCPIYLHPRVPEFLYLAVKQLVRTHFGIPDLSLPCLFYYVVYVHAEDSQVRENHFNSKQCMLGYRRASRSGSSRNFSICHNSDLVFDSNPSSIRGYSIFGVEKSMVENSAITLGRLAFVCPDLVSPHMEKCMQSWCISLSTTRDGIEKEDAFKGLCVMVKANPSVAQSSLVYVCKAIASWKKIWSTELNTEVCKVMHDYQQMLTNEAWDKFMSDLDPLVKTNIAKYLV